MAKRKLKIKKYYKRRIVKDPTIVNFILEHLKLANIEFSKMKIPFLTNHELINLD